MLDKNSYSTEEINFVKELSEGFGLPEELAIDCMASRTHKERDVVLTFLQRYGRSIKVDDVDYDQ